MLFLESGSSMFGYPSARLYAFTRDIHDSSDSIDTFRGFTFTDCSDLKQTGARLCSPIRDEGSDRGRDEVLFCTQANLHDPIDIIRKPLAQRISLSYLILMYKRQPPF